MKSVRRLAASITSSFDQFVTHIENHEAVADAALADIRRAAARQKVQLAKAEVQERHLATQVELGMAQIQQWRDRAVRTAATDRERALTCVQRSKQAQHRVRQLTDQLTAQRALVQQLRTHLNAIEQRITDLSARRALLSSRSAQADAAKVAARNSSSCDVADVFERWETQVVSAEYEHPSTAAATGAALDPLEQDFQMQEDATEFNLELDELLADAGSAAAAPAEPAPDPDTNR